MEAKKFDINSLIGFVLIGGILVYMLYLQSPTPEELEAEKAKQELVENEAAEETKEDEVSLEDGIQEITAATPGDSLALENLRNKLGSFAYSGSLPSATDATTIVENDVLELSVSNLGGHIVQAKLKEHTTHTGEAVYLIKDGNSTFNFQFSSENRLLDTQNLYFEPVSSDNGENKVLSMRLKTSANSYLEYRYELSPGEYMLNFSIRSQGLDGVINTTQPMYLDWNLKGFRQAKSIAYENRYTRLTYEHDETDFSKLSPTGKMKK